MDRIVIVLVAVATLGLLYLGYVVLSAYLGVKASPREPMFLCPKHGPIREKGIIDFFGTPYCGLCFHERLGAAERGELP
jgi:hypothetical protein